VLVVSISAHHSYPRRSNTASVVLSSSDDSACAAMLLRLTAAALVLAACVCAAPTAAPGPINVAPTPKADWPDLTMPYAGPKSGPHPEARTYADVSKTRLWLGLPVL
jgi:hypothetical protein